MRDLLGKRDVDNKADPHPQSPACQTLQLALAVPAFETLQHRAIKACGL